VEVHARHWVTASFSLANALLLVYAIHAFIGLRTSWDDIRIGLRKPSTAGTRPADAAPARLREDSMRHRLNADRASQRIATERFGRRPATMRVDRTPSTVARRPAVDADRATHVTSVI
jgi:hypothetical protein